MVNALNNYAPFVLSPIPEEICKKRRLMDIQYALQSIHFPHEEEKFEDFNAMRSEAHRRLIYDEFFFLQLGLALKRKTNAPYLVFEDGRYARDEFAVLAMRSKGMGERSLQARIEESVHAFRIKEHPGLRLSVSMGLVRVDPRKYEQLEDFLATGILVEKGKVAGIQALDCRTGSIEGFECRFLILATRRR
jgi:hypothetical protein